MEIRPVGAELFHAGRRPGGRTDRRTDRQTDMTKLTVTLRNFGSAPNNRSEIDLKKSL